MTNALTAGWPARSSTLPCSSAVFCAHPGTEKMDGKFPNLMKKPSQRSPKNRQFTLAGFKVDPKLLVDFADSFERLNVSILTVHLRSGQSDGHREINACVLPLAGTAVARLKNSPWFVPCRTVVYGIGGAKEATRFVELGINALL